MPDLSAIETIAENAAIQFLTDHPQIVENLVAQLFELIASKAEAAIRQAIANAKPV